MTFEEWWSKVKSDGDQANESSEELRLTVVGTGTENFTIAIPPADSDKLARILSEAVKISLELVQAELASRSLPITAQVILDLSDQVQACIFIVP